MCIIIAKPRGIELPPIEHIRNSWDSNPHGFACVWSNKGVVKSYATLSKKDCISFYRSLNRKLWRKMAASFHFRYATHGSKTKDNCHAYVDKDKTIGFQHNGILSYDVPHGMDITDSEYFFRFMFLPVYDANKRQMNFDHVIENLKGAGNKFCFVKDGEIYTYGSFIKDNGCWYSNNCYVPFAKSSVTVSSIKYNKNKKKNKHKQLKVFNAEDIVEIPQYEGGMCDGCLSFDCMRCERGYYGY